MGGGVGDGVCIKGLRLYLGDITLPLHRFTPGCHGKRWVGGFGPGTQTKIYHPFKG